MVFVVIQRRHKVPTLLFSCSDSFIFSPIIQKNKKHANNKNIKNIFINKPLLPKSSDPFIFYFFHKSKLQSTLFIP